MKIKTSEGIAEAMPLSDIQENNIYLKRLTFVIIGLIIIIISLFLFSFWYIKSHNIVGYPVALLKTMVENCRR